MAIPEGNLLLTFLSVSSGKIPGNGVVGEKGWCRIKGNAGWKRKAAYVVLHVSKFSSNRVAHTSVFSPKVYKSACGPLSY